MKKISFALIVMGIVMCVLMAEITAAVVVLALGLCIPMYNALASWRKRHADSNPKILNFIELMLED